MSYKIEKHHRHPIDTNDKELHCENCLSITTRQTNLCISCLCLLCCGCAPKHFCFSSQTSIDKNVQNHFERISLADFEKNHFLKNHIQFSTSKINLERTSKAIISITCQRCQITPASKTCLTCKIQHFCNYCFTQFHNTAKMKNHKFKEIKITEIKSIPQLKIDFSESRRLQTNKGSQSVRNRSDGMREMQSKTNSIFLRQQKDQPFESIASMNKLSTMVNFLQKKIQEEQNSINMNFQSLLFQINHEFQDMIEEVKLKQLQLELKIGDKMKQNMTQYEEIKQEIRCSQGSLRNMELLIKNKAIRSVFEQKIMQKLSKQTQKIQNLTKKKQLSMSFNFNQKISQQFYGEAAQLKQRLRKIDFKKIIQQNNQQHQKSSINLALPKNQKPSTGQLKFKNQSKTMKSSMNLATCKSMDRINPNSLTMSLVSSQDKSAVNKLKKLRKIETQSMTQTIYCESVNSPSEEQINLKDNQCNKFQNFDTDLKNPQLKIQSIALKKKDSRMHTLKISAKKNHKNSQNWSNSKTLITKPPNNIETTKKMIKQIRSEIRQFTNRYNYQKQTRQKQQVTEDEKLDVSSLSVESLIKIKKNQ